MKSFIFIVAILFSMAGQAFVSQGQQFSCLGTVNRWEFQIQQEQKDGQGLSLVPFQFTGVAVDVSTVEQFDVIFQSRNLRTIVIMDAKNMNVLGQLEKSGVISFARILPSGAKHITLCNLLEY
jgi:hypothetical protein